MVDIKYGDVRKFSEGLAAVCVDGKCGYIHRDGNARIPFQFESSSSFSNGIVVVNNERNRINRSGEIVWTDQDKRRDFSFRTNE